MRDEGYDTFDDVGPWQPDAPAILLRWHGDQAPEPPPWLVRNALPETGVAILAGQSGVAKTFVAVDLAGCVMSGRDFAGHLVERRGGVLFLPAEGEAELDARLAAHVGDKLVGGELPHGLDVGRLPFARQAGAVPSLVGPDAGARLVALAREAQATLASRSARTPLALIVVDTLSAAAGFQDENSASETQRVMNMLRGLSRETGALVLVVDHFGKLADTGVRGSSAKVAAADAVLAILAKKDEAGNVSERRLAKHKVRAAAAGGETPFDIRQVRLDEDGNTSCVVDWAEPTTGGATREAASDPWKGKARILRDALDAALAGQGEDIRPFLEGPMVRAAPRSAVRAEFDAAYPFDDEANADTRRRTFNRLVEEAVARKRIVARTIGERKLLWHAQA